MSFQTLRTGNLRKYYLKYYCNTCKSFAVRVHTDIDCECENGCQIHIEDVNFNKNSGIFDREEINQKFYDNEFNSLNVMTSFFENDLKFNFATLSKKESEAINDLFSQKHLTEIKIDDIIAKHYRINNLTDSPERMDNFGYVLNLIEDIHYFIIRACQDIALYDITLQYRENKVTIPFHSARFFFYNSVESIWYAFERVMVYFGLKFNFEFKSNFELNTSIKIRDFLKKDSTCINSKEYKQLKEYIDKNMNFIDDIRKNNTHNMSKHILDINQMVKKKPKEVFEKIIKPTGNTYDKNNFKPQIAKLIFAIKNLHNVLLIIADNFYNDTEFFENSSLPMLTEFEKPIDNKITLIPNKTFDLEELDKSKFKLSLKLSFVNKHHISNTDLQLLYDIFFRLEDIQKCIVDTVNLENGYLFDVWTDEISPEILKFLDENNLLYAALSRIYAVLDKLSKYVSSKYKIKNIKYFKDLSSLSTIFNSDFLNKAIKLANSEEYKLMYILRNRIAHNLSSGALMGKEGVKYDNYYIQYVVTSLTYSCYELMNLEVEQINQ